MNTGVYLDAVRQLPVVTPVELTGGRPFLVLSPHPDDESLGVGGLIAAACAAGQKVVVAILTDGSASHPCSQKYPRDRLIALRKSEAIRATQWLGLPPEALWHVGLPDGRAPLEGPLFEKVVDALSAVVVQMGAASVISTWDRDPHGDHQAAAAMAQELRERNLHLKIWSYLIWGWHIDPLHLIEVPPLKGRRIDITPWLASKQAAIFSHVSQMTDLIDDDPKCFRFDESMLAPFLTNFEYFIDASNGDQ